MQRGLIVLLAGLAGFMGGFGTGCRRPAERSAEKAVVELLPSYVGPARSYVAKVRSDSLGALMRGRVRQVVVDGVDVRLAPDLTVAELHMEADEIEVDRGRRTLRSVGKARFRARIDGREVARLVRGRSRSAVPPELKVVGSVLKVRVVPEVLGRPTVAVDVDGTVAVSDGGRLVHFVADSARLAIVPVPQSVLGFVLDRVNPVVDLSRAPVPFTIETVLLRDGSLFLRGNVPPEEVVRRSQALASEFESRR